MTLPESMVNQELANVDFTKIAALQQKRTLAFVNHFVITNVQFLNNFMRQCEQKLMNFERKLEKVNAAMVLLEAKLSSIPELNTTIPITSTEVVEESSEGPEVVDNKESDDKDATSEKPSDSSESVDEKPQTRPEYERFVKMVQVGVPLQAVKLKVSLEGLDPNVLDEILNK